MIKANSDDGSHPAGPINTPPGMPSTTSIAGRTDIVADPSQFAAHVANWFAELVNAVCKQRVHVERWLPKASFGGRVFDLRVVVIAGVACSRCD